MTFEEFKPILLDKLDDYYTSNKIPEKQYMILHQAVKDAIYTSELARYNRELNTISRVYKNKGV